MNDFISVVPENRLIGGSNTGPNEIKYHLSLRTRINWHYCMGALLSSKWGLTAASCVVGRELFDVNMVTGSHTVTGGVPHATKRIVVHSSFDRNRGIYE